MAQIIISNSGSGSNANMKCRLTYTAGNGTITVTNVECCRTDSYDTNSNTTSTSDNIVYVSIGGTQLVAQHNNWIYFKKSSVYTSNWSGSVSKSNLAGDTNVTVTFKCSQNSNINNAKFSTTIDAGYSYPTISISGAGSSTTNRATISSTGLSFKVTLGRMNSRTGTLTYDGTTYTTYNSDGEKTITLTAAQAQAYLNKNPNADNFTMSIKIAIGSFTATATLYLVMNANIKPVLNSVTISGSTSDYPSLVNKFVQNLTRPIFTFSGTGSYSSTISKYYLSSVDGYGSNLFPIQITGTTYNATNAFPKDGPITATAYCIDSRTRTSDSKVSSSINVIPYYNPTVNYTIKRCLQDGTLDNEGTYCKLHIEYNFAPINDGSTNLNTKTIQYSLNASTWVNVTLSAWSGSTDLVFNNNGSAFSTSQNYNIYVKYSDVSITNQSYKTLEVSYTLISKRAGGKGVTLGKIATEDNLNIYMPTTIQSEYPQVLIKNNTGDVAVKAIRTDTNVAVRLQVGTGGTNHGVFSEKLNKWMLYADDTNVYLNGNATNVTEKITASAKTHTNYNTNQSYVPSMSFLSFWNGAYNSSNSSNLTYSANGTIYGSSNVLTKDFTVSVTPSTNRDNHGYGTVAVTMTGVSGKKVLAISFHGSSNYMLWGCQTALGTTCPSSLTIYGYRVSGTYTSAVTCTMRVLYIN